MRGYESRASIVNFGPASDVGFQLLVQQDMNRSFLRRFATLSIAWLAIACGGSPIAPSAATLDGTWSALDEIPGSGEQWILDVQGSSIGGTGTWSGEACCVGTLSVTGTITGDSIRLDLSYETSSNQTQRTFHKRFDGALTSRTVLRGVVTLDDGTTGVQRLQRQ